MKHRTLIEMLAFITVALLVIVLYFCGFFVFAESNIFNFTRYNIGSITRNSVDDQYSIYINESDVTYDYIWSTYSPNFNFNCSADDISMNGADCYIMSGSGSAVVGYYMPADTFIIFDEYGYARIFCPKTNYDVYMSNNNNNLIDGEFYAEYTSFGYTSLPNTSNVDNEPYSCTSHLSNFKCLSSNCAIYQVPDVDLFTSLDDIMGDNINPNYSGGSSSTSSKLAFNPNSLYTYFNQNFGGGVVCDVGINDEQKALDSQYGINFYFNFGIRFKGSLPSTMDLGLATPVPILKNVQFDGVGEYVCPLSSFNNGHLELPNSMVLNTVRGNLTVTINQDTQTYNNITFLQAMDKIGVTDLPLKSTDSSSMGLSVKGFSISLPLFSNSNYDYFDFDYSATPKCNNLVGGDIRFKYGAVSGVANYSTTMPNELQVQTDVSNYNSENGYQFGDPDYDNPNNYLPTTTSPSFPSSSGSNSSNSSASTGGSIAYGSNVNNSVIVNTGQDAKEVINYAKNELLPGNYEGGYVEKLETVTDSNNFIQYMSTTFSFMPQTFWNDVAYYGKIALIILVSGFILSLVRRLIT